jgi:Mitochondrial genome maintenance MGM101
MTWVMTGLCTFPAGPRLSLHTGPIGPTDEPCLVNLYHWQCQNTVQYRYRMMSHLFTNFRAARLPLRVVSSSRTYVVGGKPYTLPRSFPANKTPLAAQVSTTQPNSTKGNPEIVDSYPTTAREIEADVATQSEIINNTPPESIPSSGALALDPLLDTPPTGSTTDWSRSYHGLSTQPFPQEVADMLQAAIDPLDIEMKPGSLSRRIS